MDAVHREQDADNQTADNVPMIPSEHLASPNGPEEPTSPVLEPEHRVQSPASTDHEMVASAKDPFRSPNIPSNESSLQSHPEQTSSLDSKPLPDRPDESPGEDKEPPARISSDTPATGAEEKLPSKESSRVNNVKQGLHRFRTSSLSLRNKPKLWGGRERDAKEHAEDPDGNEAQASGGAEKVEKQEKHEKQEKTKMPRFGLGRKKSTQLL